VKNSEAQENSKLSQIFNHQLDFITKPVALIINKAAVVERGEHIKAKDHLSNQSEAVSQQQP